MWGILNLSFKHIAAYIFLFLRKNLQYRKSGELLPNQVCGQEGNAMKGGAMEVLQQQQPHFELGNLYVQQYPCYHRQQMMPVL